MPGVDVEDAWQVAAGQSKAGLHSAQLAQSTPGRLTIVFSSLAPTPGAQ